MQPRRRYPNRQERRLPGGFISVRSRRIALALLAATIALGFLAAACKDGGSNGGTTPAATPSPTITVVPAPGVTSIPPEVAAVIFPLLPTPEDLPSSIPPFGPPQGFTPNDLYGVTQFASPTPTAGQVASWRFIGGGVVSYLNPEPLPTTAPANVSVSIFLHEDEGGADAYFEFSKTYPSKGTVTGFEGQVGRDVDQFAEFTEPAVGEETRIVTFGSHSKSQSSQEWQGYYVYSRRGRVVEVVFAQGLKGQLGLDDLIELARNVDARVKSANL